MPSKIRPFIPHTSLLLNPQDPINDRYTNRRIYIPGATKSKRYKCSVPFTIHPASSGWMMNFGKEMVEEARQILGISSIPKNVRSLLTCTKEPRKSFSKKTKEFCKKINQALSDSGFSRVTRTQTEQLVLFLNSWSGKNNMGRDIEYVSLKTNSALVSLERIRTQRPRNSEEAKVLQKRHTSEVFANVYHSVEESLTNHLNEIGGIQTAGDGRQFISLPVRLFHEKNKECLTMRQVKDLFLLATYDPAPAPGYLWTRNGQSSVPANKKGELFVKFV